MCEGVNQFNLIKYATKNIDYGPLTHYSLTATIVTAQSKYRLKKGSWKNSYVASMSL